MKFGDGREGEREIKKGRERGRYREGDIKSERGRE